MTCAQSCPLPRSRPAILTNGGAHPARHRTNMHNTNSHPARVWANRENARRRSRTDQPPSPGPMASGSFHALHPSQPSPAIRPPNCWPRHKKLRNEPNLWGRALARHPTPWACRRRAPRRSAGLRGPRRLRACPASGLQDGVLVSKAPPIRRFTLANAADPGELNGILIEFGGTRLQSPVAWAAVLSLLVLSPVCLWAGAGGSISGTVWNLRGLPVSGAQVTATNTATNLRQTVASDASGVYAFPDLAVGTYDLEVAASGFRTYRASQLAVDTNSAFRVDVHLVLGARNEQITVTANATHVETVDTQLGEVESGTKITAVPLNGRSFTDLLALQPGVAPSHHHHGEFHSGGRRGHPVPLRRSESGHHVDQRPTRICQWLHGERRRRSGALHHGAPPSSPISIRSPSFASSRKLRC